jgi:hypothetical protein
MEVNLVEVKGTKYILYITGNRIKYIEDAIRSLISSCLNSTDDTFVANTVNHVLQQICRTRIGEYCYNSLSTPFLLNIILAGMLPVYEGEILVTVNNTMNMPIEIQLNTKIFKKDDEWKWGLCISSCFFFKYSVR